MSIPPAGRSVATILRMTEPLLCPLSAREIEVVECVANGDSNSEVAGRLGLSPNTIKSHLIRIARKVGTGDRAAIVAVCLRSGWIA